MKRKPLFKKADAAVIAVLLLPALVLLLFTGRGKTPTAYVIEDGETLYEIRLGSVKEPYILELENGVTVSVAPGEIRFASSDCRGQDCVRCGVLTKAGQAAACVPNKTVIVLKGTSGKGAPDAVSY